MSSRFQAIRIGCGIGILALLLASTGQETFSGAGDAKPIVKEDKTLFGPTKVWAVHLDISAKEFDAMQPVLGGGFGPPGGPQPKKAAKK